MTSPQRQQPADTAMRPAQVAAQAGAPETVVAEMVSRAAHPDYRRWWQAVTGTGFCAHPIHLQRRHGQLATDRLMLRCGNRRAAVCPSCSRLYAGDTWQLVHAGIVGGHHGIADTVTDHPMAFVTLTAPSYGKIRATGRQVGEPADPARYDYPGHVLFTWWVPELWRRYTIRLRRLLTALLRERGHDPDRVRLTFLKVCENQARLIPHLHTVLRLDAASTPGAGGCVAPAPPNGVAISSADLAALALRAAAQTSMTVVDPTTDTGHRTIGFGSQVDARPLDPSLPVAARRKIAGYLAKYVTKSVTDHGITATRISPRAAGDPAALAGISSHAQTIIATLAGLAESVPAHYSAMLRWLHTLGYRGHVTTKSRRYSTTMTALRTTRALWRHHHPTNSGGAAENVDAQTCTAESLGGWSYAGSGHPTRGDHLLAITGAKARLDQLWARRDSLQLLRSGSP